ncbi:MAG: hypothetical protein HS104_01690 [Polyangiaceae bacterium]|nr:hypothetical protein [Polyangiaceae bacterium]MCE7889256.1 hypothetical protein [Sorangiineae bacterium PRO1]MCL4755207.1 hypothetical protein [Myxococcales bacterium]
MKLRLMLWWSLGLSALLLHACGGKVDDVPSRCEPGSVRVCGGSGVAGPCYQQCLPSGDAFSDCVCSGGGPGGGGSGGYPTGGTGAYGGYPVGGGGYPTGGGGGLPCGSCPDYKVAGLINLPACCAPDGSCAAQVDSTVAALVGMSPGCYPTNQPGAPDPGCPALTYTNPLDGGPGYFPGCCGAKTGTCGVTIDLTSVQGPVFGCTDVGAGGGGPQKCGGPSGNCDLCVQVKCAAEISKCMQTPACAAIIACAGACTDQPCVDKCIFTNPAGQPVFQDFMTCVGQYCAPDCQ